MAAHGTREMPVWGYAFMFQQGALAGPFVPKRTPQGAEEKIAKLMKRLADAVGLRSSQAAARRPRASLKA